MNLKSKWRQDMRSTIKLITKEKINEIEVKCFNDLKTFLMNLKNIKSIACYISTSLEININNFINWAIRNKYQIFLPVVNKEHLVFKQISNLKTLKLNNNFNVYEPTDGEVSYNIDLIIIPLLGYSNNNHRLGYGKGYYDRFLFTNPIKTLGIGFLKTEVPTNIFEEHDIRLTNMLLF